MKVDFAGFPPGFQKEYDKLSPQAQQHWQVDRLRAQIDHMYLGCDVMGMDFQPVPHIDLFRYFLPKNPDKHLYDLDTKIKKRMILWSRGLFKTSAVIVEIVQLIINYPDIRICFVSGSQTLARRQLARVKRTFERPTKRFKQLFPEFCGDRLGNMDEFTVPNRSADSPLAEPTVCISTAKSVNASAHFDVMFFDDLVHEQNYKNSQQLEATKDSYLSMCPLLAPDGFMYVTGTRYSFGDTYEWIQERAEQEIKELGSTIWQFSVRPCWVRICTCQHPDSRHDSDKNYTHPPCTIAGCHCLSFTDTGKKDVLFPKFRTKDGRTEGHTIEFLEGERIRLGAEMFSCQYENSPLVAGSQTFTPELINQQTLYHLKQIPEGPTFMVGDLSYVGNDERDECVLYICRLFEGQICVFHCIYGKWDSITVAEQIFGAVLTYRPHIVWIERFNGWEAYDTVFRMFCEQKGIQRFPIEWHKLDQRKGAKTLRIGSVQSVLAQRRLWLFAGMPQYERLVYELKRWPKVGKHDDYADCLGLVCAVPSGYSQVRVAGPPIQSGLDYLKQLKEDSEARLHSITRPMMATNFRFPRSPLEEEEGVSNPFDTRIPGSY